MNRTHVTSLYHYLPFHAWSIGESCDEAADDDETDDDDDVCGRSSFNFCASVSAFWAR